MAAPGGNSARKNSVSDNFLVPARPCYAMRKKSDDGKLLERIYASMLDTPSWRERLREPIIGEARSSHDRAIFSPKLLARFLNRVCFGG